MGRSPGEGKGYPLQYSGLENSRDCIVHGVTNSWIQLKEFHSFTQSKLAQTRNGESEARNLTTLLGKIVFFIPLGSLGFPGGSDGKESACNAGDMDSIPGLGRSLREGRGYPLQYSGLENSMDCIVHGVAELDMTERLSLFIFHLARR